MKAGALPAAAVVGAAGSFVAALLAVAAVPVLAFGAVSQAAFVLPGIAIVRAMASGRGWLPALAFGPLLGHALGCFAMTLLWVAGGRGPWLMLAAPLLVTLLVWPARRLDGRWKLPATAPGDATGVALLMILAVMIVVLPFAHVGEITPDGQAYRAYFTADYVWRRAVVAELAKGASPLPVNQFFDGDVMRYYWMPHILDGAQYRFAQAWASLDELLLIRSLSINAFFVTFLYGMARTFGVRWWAAATGVAFVLLSTSFEGLYALFDFSTRDMPISAVKSLNIDALSRWYFQGMPIDGLQRVLFYQPHHIIGYTMGLLGLMALAVRTRPLDGAAFAIAGVCLGLSLAISSFAGLMCTVAAMLYEAASLLRSFDIRRGVVHAFAAGVPLAVAVGVVFGLGYVDRSGAVVELTVNPVSTHRFAAMTLLSCGPILIATLLAVPAIRARQRGLAVLGALAVTSIAFYFFVNVRDHGNVYTGWRVGHFMFMSAAVVIGVLVEHLATSASATQPFLTALAAAAFLGGVPTTVIDIYNTQDITNFSEAPAGKMTLLLRPDDLQAFDWIKRNTRADARVQVDPVARGQETWAYVPAFAERRMSVGLPISMVPLAKYQQGSDAIARMFDETPLAAYERAVRAKVNYLLIGPPERQAHPGVEERFESVSNLMPLVFRNGSISIYEIR